MPLTASDFQPWADWYDSSWLFRYHAIEFGLWRVFGPSAGPDEGSVDFDFSPYFGELDHLKPGVKAFPADLDGTGYSTHGAESSLPTFKVKVNIILNPLALHLAFLLGPLKGQTWSITDLEKSPLPNDPDTLQFSFKHGVNPGRYFMYLQKVNKQTSIYAGPTIAFSKM